MGTVRLTAAQALVRFLARAVRRAGRRPPALLRRLLRDLRPRQRGRASARRCSQHAELAAVPPGAQRAGDGARRRRLRADAEPARRARLHELDRARARRTWSPARRSRRSTGCRCCCSPATSSHAPARPGAAAARGAARGRRLRERRASGPSRATSTASRGRSRWSPAALQAMRVLTSPAETGAVTLALPAGRAGRGVRLPGGVPRRARLARARAPRRRRSRSRARSRRSAARSGR